MLNSKIIHIQVYQVAKGGGSGWEGRVKVRHVWPTDSHRWTDKIKHFFFSYRVLFGKLRGGPRRIGPLLQSCLLLHKIHNRISRRGGNTWRDGESPGDGRDLERGKKGFFGFGVHKLQIWNHIVPYCLSLSLFLSGEEESTVWITHSLSYSLPFFLNGVLVTRARSSTALKWKKHQKKTTESLVV